MSDIAIRAENLSKVYRLGQFVGYDTWRESLERAFHTSLRRFHHAIAKQSGECENDSSKYVWALRDVSFEVKRGEAIGIIGSNGAGKTTLLKVLSRITNPTEGYAEIHGRVGSLLEVGTGFHPELTGRENIYLNGAVLGMKRAEINKRFDEIVEFSGVGTFIDTPLKRYSSGMQIRLAFSVAAHLDPEILLVDEVLAVGDIEFQKRCLGRMGEIAGAGRTVLFISHNMLSIQSLCTRGILLEKGRISMEGSIAKVINHYYDQGRTKKGEVSWASADVAPGNKRVRVKAVRVVSENDVTGHVDISKEFHIEVDYWNLEANSRRLVGVQLHNSLGIWVFASSNLPFACVTPDPWFTRSYPSGLFRTSCAIPGNILNDGGYSISVFINAAFQENIVICRDILTFDIEDTGAMREGYAGKWDGVIRLRLDWNTKQLE